MNERSSEMKATYDDKRVEIRAVGESDIDKCYSVISQLRPYLTDQAAWNERAKGLLADGYRMLAAWEGEEVVAMAGYRLNDNLIYGRFLYIDDLVSDEQKRGAGLGARLLDALQKIGRDAECHYMVLDTAVTNVEARKFYRREGLMDLAVGFIKPLDEASAENLRQYAEA